MKAYSLDFREKIVESVKKGIPKSETARRFGVHRATVKRYCKQFDEHASLEPGKAPGKASKLDEKARKLLLGDLQERPWATHSQRAQFLVAVAGVSVSEATVCRTIKRLSCSRKKVERGSRKRRVLEAPLAYGDRPRGPQAIGVRRRDGHSHLPGSPLCLRARRRTGFLRDPHSALQ